MSRWSLAAGLLALLACDQGTEPQPWLFSEPMVFPPPSGAHPLDGDWFPCRDLDCAELDEDDGFRFDNGFAYEIHSIDHRSHPIEGYCLEDLIALLGTSDAGGSQFVLRLPFQVVERDGTLVFEIVLHIELIGDGNRMLMRSQLDEDVLMFQRILPPRAISECGRNQPTVIDVPPPPPRS